MNKEVKTKDKEEVKELMSDHQRILDFLLSADFKVENNYSYSELLLFLQYYKNFYRQSYEKNQDLRYILDKAEAHIKKLEVDMIEKERQLESCKKQLSAYKKIVSRKLTFFERLTGKIKL